MSVSALTRAGVDDQIQSRALTVPLQPRNGPTRWCTQMLRPTAFLTMAPGGDRHRQGTAQKAKVPKGGEMSVGRWSASTSTRIPLSRITTELMTTAPSPPSLKPPPCFAFSAVIDGLLLRCHRSDRLELRHLASLDRRHRRLRLALIDSFVATILIDRSVAPALTDVSVVAALIDSPVALSAPATNVPPEFLLLYRPPCSMCRLSFCFRTGHRAVCAA